MKIQSILFDKDQYTSLKARVWLRKHGYIPIKRVHKTINQLRYRILPPNFKRYIAKKTTKGISFVIGI